MINTEIVQEVKNRIKYGDIRDLYRNKVMIFITAIILGSSNEKLAHDEVKSMQTVLTRTGN